MCKKPKVASANAVPEETKTYRFDNIIEPIAENYLPFFYNHADVIIAPTKFTKSRLRELGVKKRIELISNGIDTKKFKYSEKKRKIFRKKYNIKKEDVVVYMIGGICLRKGIDTFLEIAERIPEYTFVWIGKHFLNKFFEKKYGRVERMIKNAPENVLFTGFVDDIISAHCAGDIFFFPSYAENEGIAILEAGSCRRPVIVRNIMPYDEWLFNNKNCFKFNNEEELEKSIRRLGEDEKLRKRMGRRMRKTAEKKNISKTGKKLIKMYKSLL